ncbi:MAG: hypothetical protein MAG451_01948 [Anaerolineales bacterium]|nr:hypothetical protein [Anaerolineales bacterium]
MFQDIDKSQKHVGVHPVQVELLRVEGVIVPAAILSLPPVGDDALIIYEARENNPVSNRRSVRDFVDCPVAACAFFRSNELGPLL